MGHNGDNIGKRTAFKTKSIKKLFGLQELYLYYAIFSC